MERKPATEFYLTIRSDKLWIEFDGTHGGRHSRQIMSENDLRQFLISKANEAGIAANELSVMASSALDFPEEFTKNAETIALARAIK